MEAERRIRRRKDDPLKSNFILLLHISLQDQLRIQKEEAKKLPDLEASCFN